MNEEIQIKLINGYQFNLLQNFKILNRQYNIFLFGIFLKPIHQFSLLWSSLREQNSQWLTLEARLVRFWIQYFTLQEYQRGIGTRQPLYDSINRSGRTLKDKCPPEDVTDIQRMLIELKTKWNTVCSKSVDR